MLWVITYLDLLYQLLLVQQDDLDVEGLDVGPAGQHGAAA